VLSDQVNPPRGSLTIWALVAAVAAFVLWASTFRIDQVARATGEVVAKSRIQVIQAVDSGVLAELRVTEGDRVEKGQVIAKLDQSRIGAAVKEIEARLAALQAKATRLRAEVTDTETLVFPVLVESYPEQALVEKALFNQRRSGFVESSSVYKKAVANAREEVSIVQQLVKSGDVNQMELIRAKRTLNDAEVRAIEHSNRFYEQASNDLTRVEDEIAQNEQVLAQRQQQLEDSVFIAKRRGIVKNISVTTVGGVLRAGEELMQIVPLDDDLIIEAKISPVDISQVQVGQPATVRFDPFDYTIYGSVKGTVKYVSADTIKEQTSNGDEIYYRAHLVIDDYPVTTTSGKTLEILPGMTAQVDIRSGDRTLLVYLLKPLRKTLSESLGER
jgi:adhesin transport system membrane fusion protein